METVQYIWMNGVQVPWDQAQMHVLTHSLHYGGAVFEGIRFYETSDGPAIFRLKDHVERFFQSARVLQMNIPYLKDEIIAVIRELVRSNGITSGYIRPIAYFAYGKMGLNPQGCPVHVAVGLWPWGAYLEKDVVRVKLSQYRRLHPETIHVEAKVTGHYVNSILASLEAHGLGFDEALLLDTDGNVAEGPGENIFFVKNSILYTPKRGSILPGITRDSVMKLAKDHNFECKEKKIRMKELLQADEAFFTGTAAEITAIGSIDDVPVRNGSMGTLTKMFRNLYFDVVHGKNDVYRHWLDVV
ncbi:branched-chain amino acid transaminase [Candidatus Peregrinibacteria bacterium]|nr:branched-chain amino acid transaminase [Candidatus Peregrinibacteria bacterium]